MAKGRFRVVVEGAGSYGTGHMHDADEIAGRMVHDLMNSGHAVVDARVQHEDGETALSVSPRAVPASPAPTPRKPKSPPVPAPRVADGDDDLAGAGVVACVG